MVQIKVLDAKCAPFKKYQTDAGFDLYIREGGMLLPHATHVFWSGVQMAIPAGQEGQIRPRSSARKRGLSIEGTIDAAYRGEVGITITNTTDKAVMIETGERLAQCVVSFINPFFTVVQELDETERGSGGFGHTGRF